SFFFFFFQAEDGIRDFHVTGVQTCALPISSRWGYSPFPGSISGRDRKAICVSPSPMPMYRPSPCLKIGWGISAPADRPLSKDGTGVSRDGALLAVFDKAIGEIADPRHRRHQHVFRHGQGNTQEAVCLLAERAAGHYRDLLPAKQFPCEFQPAQTGCRYVEE